MSTVRAPRRMPPKQQSPEAIYGPRPKRKPVRTEAVHVRAHPKDRALAVAIVRLAKIEATSFPAEAQHIARATLDEIANLAPVLALNVAEVREHTRKDA